MDITLIIQPGYSAGWDIILPTCWIQSFFISFIMWGARAGGLRETESLAFEACKSDVLYPDTEAGFMEEDAVTQLYKNRFFRFENYISLSKLSNLVDILDCRPINVPTTTSLELFHLFALTGKC